MLRRLEYTGLPNPHENLDGFIAHLRMNFPQLFVGSDAEVRQRVNRVIYRATVERGQRFRIGRANKMFIFFGDDIYSDSPDSNPSWIFLSDAQKIAVAHMTPEQKAQAISVPGLSQTYVFCWQNAWTQEMPQADYEAFMRSRKSNLFKDPDVHGPHTEVRSYDFEPSQLERVPITVGSNPEQDAKKAWDYYMTRKEYVQGGVPERKGA